MTAAASKGAVGSEPVMATVMIAGDVILDLSGDAFQNGKAPEAFGRRLQNPA
ncbi:hypothetical protein LQ948_01135 [Jiella sp. MQZ9-1]|nr:hypothetical protein [Jiella flava]